MECAHDTMASRHDRASCGAAFVGLWPSRVYREHLYRVRIFRFYAPKTPHEGGREDPARGGAERRPDGAHVGPRDRLVD